MTNPTFNTLDELTDNARKWSRLPGLQSVDLDDGSTLYARGLTTSWGPYAAIVSHGPAGRVVTTTTGPRRQAWSVEFDILIARHRADRLVAELEALAYTAMFADDAGDLADLRDHYVREALDADVPAATLARITNLSRTSIYRIRDRAETIPA